MRRRRRTTSAEERRALLARDVVEWAIVVALLALLARPLALVVGVIWAIRLVRRGLRELFSPALRERWVERELARRQAASKKRENVPLARSENERARGLVQRMGEDPGAETNVVHAHAALAELDRVERSISQMLRNARPQAAPRPGAS